jgi:hypothetical protein
VTDTPIDGRTPTTGEVSVSSEKPSQTHHEHAEDTAHTPGDLVFFLYQYPPAKDAPLSEQVLWHELLANLWEQIAAEHAFMTDNAQYLINYHCRMANRWVTSSTAAE